MATVIFEDGTKVRFDGQPTMQDIDDAVAALGLKPKVIPQEERQSIPAIATSPFRGAAKSFARTALGVGAAGEKISSAAARLATGGKEVPGFTDVAPFTAAREKLAPQGIGEKIGAFGEQAVELLLPVGKGEVIAKGASFAQKALGLGKLALKEGVEAGAKTAIQTGGELDDAGIAAGIAAVAGPFSKAVGASVPAVSRYLEKINLRLTPTQKTNLGEELGKVTDYLAKQKIIGNPASRFEKVTALYDETEKTLQSFLTKDAGKVSINRKELIDELNALKPSFKNDADALAIDRQIDQAIETLRAKQETYIKLSDLNELKRSVYKNAFNPAGDKVRDDVEFAIGDVYRRKIEQGAGSIEGLKIKGKTLADFNAEYGTLIKARKLLKIASGRQEVGLVGKTISSLLGSSFGGGPFGAAVGLGAANTIAGTSVRSLIGTMLESVGQKPTEESIDAMSKVLMTFLNQQESQ